MTTLSLCMIVKNEEKVLARCLESVKDAVDEIIIVDTGSTDRTKEIAKQYGAQIFDFTWIDDFAAARQFAKEKATKDWILQLDADEYFMNDEAKNIKDEIEKATNRALTIRISNLEKKGEIGTSHIHCRLFKNDPEFTYRYRIHEQISVKGSDMEFGYSNLRIIHTGYTAEVIVEKEKHKRNIKILEKELEEDPENGFMNLNISNEYMLLGDFKKAFEYAKLAYKNGKYRSYQSRAVVNIIQSLMNMKEYEQALKVLMDAKEYFKRYTDLTYLEGNLYELQGRDQDAIRAYKECTVLGESDPMYQTKKGISTLYPYERLISIYLRKRELKEVVEFSKKYLEINKNNPQILAIRLSLMKNEYTEEEIIQYMENRYPEEDLHSTLLKIGAMHGLRCGKGFCKFYLKNKDNKEIFDDESRMYFYLYQEQWNNAKEIVEKAIKDKSDKKDELSLMYYIHSRDKCIEGSEQLHHLFHVIVGKVEDKEIKVENVKGKSQLFIKVLRELALLKRFGDFEKVLALKENFDSSINKDIGEIFYAEYMDELAIECFAQYLKVFAKDKLIFDSLTQILFSKGFYEEAIIFAEQRIREMRNRLETFGPFEVLIESYQKLGAIEEAQKACEIAIEIFPDSSYVINQIENIM